MSKLTIVMYHHVREIKNSKYPKIKGLEFVGFKRQLDYLEKKWRRHEKETHSRTTKDFHYFW